MSFERNSASAPAQLSTTAFVGNQCQSTFSTTTSVPTFTHLQQCLTSSNLIQLGRTLQHFEYLSPINSTSTLIFQAFYTIFPHFNFARCCSDGAECHRYHRYLKTYISESRHTSQLRLTYISIPDRPYELHQPFIHSCDLSLSILATQCMHNSL